LIDSATLEYKDISKNFSIHKLPALIYVNKTQLGAINHDNVLLIDENFTIDSLRETIFNQINDPKNTPSQEVSPSSSFENRNQSTHHDNDFHYDREYFPETDADLIHHQNKELRELERQAEEQRRKEQNEKEEKEKKVREEKKKARGEGNQ